MTDAGAAMGGYRYVLHRKLSDDNPRRACFLMLNPSTATEEQDDQTIRKCKSFAESWGYGQLTVVNLFALRATKPRSLKLSARPIGELNDDAILLHTSIADLIVCAWGIHGDLYGRDRTVTDMLLSRGHELHCVGLTKGGHPRHPLFAPKISAPLPYYPPTPARFGYAAQPPTTPE